MLLQPIVVFACFCAVQARYYTRTRTLNTKEIREADSTVILTHVIFRHGNRTAELGEVYPNDPYLNDTYFPIGRGQLTNAGKVREYQVGQDLRKRYNSLLGEYHYPEIVDAVTTNKNRTKASLELVLASLFPPTKELVWNSQFIWQPVPYNYYPVDQDPVLFGINCVNYVKQYNDLIASTRWQDEFAQHTEIFDYISKFSGLNVTMYQDVYDLYFGLSTEEEFGQKLPDWTSSVWPKIITDMAVREYFVQTGTIKLTSIAQGFLLKKIIEDTKKKNPDEKYGTKMYLYSAHENNLAELQVLLKVFHEPHVPTYGSYLIFEVHNIENVIGIKLFYNHYTSSGLENLKIPGCGEFCPLDKFQKLYEKYLPDSEELCYNVD